MSKPSQSIYQFKITLEEVKPAVWRRIQVPSSYNFWELHVAIQNAMGWEDYHLHEFEILNLKTGRPQRIGSDGAEECISGRKVKIEDCFSMENNMAFYEYDFGDGWSHRIVLEKILPADPGKTYPLCLDGKRACPPEDCGGPWGYEELLEVLKNPRHADYKDVAEWIGDKNFDPESFKAEEIVFENPKEHVDISEG